MIATSAPWLLLVVCVVRGLPAPEYGTQSQPRLLNPTRSVQLPNFSAHNLVRSPAGGWANDAKKPPREDSFVFPSDDSEETFAPLTVKQSCPNGTKFCESVPDYPSSYLDSILQNSAKDYQALFGNDLVEDEKLTHRIDLLHNENPLCDSNVQIVFPKQAEDKDGLWKYVVNTDKYKQGVRVETCRSDDDAVCNFSEYFPNGYQARCKQKHIYRKLVAMNGNVPETMEFPLPSCCQCVVESVPSVRISDTTPAITATTPKKRR